MHLWLLRGTVVGLAISWLGALWHYGRLWEDLQDHHHHVLSAFNSTKTSPNQQQHQHQQPHQHRLDIVLPILSSSDKEALLLFASRLGELVVHKEVAHDWKIRWFVAMSSLPFLDEDLRFALAERSHLPASSIGLVPVATTTNATSRFQVITALLQSPYSLLNNDDNTTLLAIITNWNLQLLPTWLTHTQQQLTSPSSTIIYAPTVFAHYAPDAVRVAHRVFGQGLGAWDHHVGRWRDSEWDVVIATASTLLRLPGLPPSPDDLEQPMDGDHHHDNFFVSQLRTPNNNNNNNNVTVIRRHDEGLLQPWRDRPCRDVSSDEHDDCVQGSPFVQTLQEEQPDVYQYLLRRNFDVYPGKRSREQALRFVQSIAEDTGSFDNCQDGSKNNNDVVVSNDLSMLRQGRGTVTVSCRNISFRLHMPSFPETAKVLTGVLSASSGHVRRQVIRETWASSSSSSSGVFFVVSGAWDAIAQEFDEFGDLIWLDLPEDYDLLTYKTAAWLSIVYQVSQQQLQTPLTFTHVLKTDENSYVALHRLGAHLTRLEEASVVDYWGSCRDKKGSPCRDPNDKYYVSYDDHPQPKFPLYCQGAGFVVSRAFVQCAAFSEIKNIRFLRFEDAYVGMLAERCNVTTSPTSNMVRDWRFGGRQSGAVAVERARVRMQGPSVADVELPKADMTGRIIQHRINSDQDMREHHRAMSASPSFVGGKSKGVQ